MSSGVKRSWESDPKSNGWGDISEILGNEPAVYEGDVSGLAAPSCVVDQFEELNRAIELAGEGEPAADLITCAALLASGLRADELVVKDHAPQPSNTGGMIRKVTRKEDGAKLQPPSFYRSASAEEWTETDPKLFKSLPQGGGGIDWLTFSAWGSMSDHAVVLRNALKYAKEHFGLEPDAFRAACAEVGLEVSEYSPRCAAIFVHPYVEGGLLRLADATYGKGRQFQPLIVATEGITVKYGARDNSNSGAVLCSVEVPGTIWLRLGEEKALHLVQRVLSSLGLTTVEMKSSRFDACADIPGMDVQTFVDLFTAGNGAGAFHAGSKVTYGKDGKAETFVLESEAVQLVIYDKVKEVAKDQTGEKLPLMIAHRWGRLPEKAVRVEWRFKISKVRSKPKKGQTNRYKTLRELFEGLGELLGWAMNVWARFCIRDGTKNCDRSPYADAWLRVLHAFAYWSHRFGKRPTARPVKPLPQIQLMKQASGTFAAAFGSRGIVPKDEWTAWSLMSDWLGPDDLVSRCLAKAKEAQCLRGVPITIVDPFSYESEMAENGRIRKS